MEQNFQTSFIPKKPTIRERVTTRKPIGLLTVIAIFIFLALAIGTVGLYFFQGVLTNNLKKMDQDLNLAKNRFEPAKITQFQTLDKRLRAAHEILSQHIVLSPVFDLLSSITGKNIRYTDFNYELDKEKGLAVKISLSGEAVNYRSIALQSDLFTQNKNLIDPVFSDLSLDDSGNVLFDLEFYIEPNFVNYQQNILTREEDVFDNFSEEQLE